MSATRNKRAPKSLRDIACRAPLTPGWIWAKIAAESFNTYVGIGPKIWVAWLLISLTLPLWVAYLLVAAPLYCGSKVARYFVVDHTLPHYSPQREEVTL
jgi:hypothetical protein